MKQIIFLLLMAAACNAKAQYSSHSEAGSSIRTGIAYVHDFPGLHGAAAYAEYNFPLNEWLQGGVGLKRIQTAGFPRTQTVREYTKATALDVSLLFVPLHTENAALRIGVGYSFSFYNVRRSYPVYTAHADPSTASDVSWPQKDIKGKVQGVNLIGEYEYYFNSRFSAGAKIALCKAYGSVLMGGPFVGMRW